MTRRLPYEPAPPPSNRVSEVRVGRNFIREGDLVRVKPTLGRHDGFDARFRYAEIEGDRTTVCVVGAPRGRAICTRFFPLDRIERRQQTHGGEPRGV